MAAQLTGIQVPASLRNSVPSSQCRLPVKPLIYGMLLPPVAAPSPRATARTSTKKAPPKEEKYVPPQEYDMSKVDPDVKRAWQKLHDIFKANMSLVAVTFQRADTDHSGKLSKFELHQVLYSFRVEGLTHNLLSKLIDIADKDGDGEINYREFLRFIKAGVPDEGVLKEHKEQFSKEREREILQVKRQLADRIETRFGKLGLQKAFRSIDQSKDNKLERYEIKQFLYSSNLVPEMVSDQNLNALLDQLDSDGDNQINYAEFCRLVWADHSSLDSLRRGQQAHEN